MSSPLRLFSLVLNWNRPKDTLACLESLRKQTDCSLELIVVDNGSTDRSVEQIQQAYPQAHVIANAENLYFGAGANVGLLYALSHGADYVLFINNDAILAPDALMKMLAQAAGDIGILAPMIYYHDQPDVIWSMGGRVRPLLMEVAHLEKNRCDKGGWPETIEQDFVTSCCVLFSRAMLKTVGLYDTKTFLMYYEDADLCVRTRKAGLRIVVVPDAKCWHKVAMSSGGEDSPQERYWTAKSSVLYFRKHVRNAKLFLIVPFRVASAVRQSFRLAKKKRWAAIGSYWRGLWDGFVGSNNENISP